MTSDLPLFMVTCPHSGTQTSKDAAADARAFALKQRQRVLLHISACGDYGATRQEIAAVLGMSGDSVRPRVVELLEHNAVRVSEQVRRSSSGRPCEVLELVR